MLAITAGKSICAAPPPARGGRSRYSSGMDEAGSPSAAALVLTGIAVVLAIVGVITRPFIFEPIAALCLLVAARSTPSRRLTFPVACLITICFVVGAGLAAATSNPLY
jgi:hypothetical protein